MPENHETRRDPDYSKPNIDPDWRFGTTVVLVALPLGIFGLWKLCSNIPQPEYFWTAFVGGCVSYCILLAAIVQIRVTNKQWRVMREELDLTEDMFDVGERAYLDITDINIPGETFSYSLSDKFVFDLTNGGKTPAFNVRVKTKPTIVKKDIDEELIREMKSGMYPVEVLHPLHLAGRKETFTFSIGDMLPDGTNERWKSGEIRVFVPIRIAYEDVHRDTQYLTYWYEFLPNKHPVLRRPLEYKVAKRKKKRTDY